MIWSLAIPLLFFLSALAFVFFIRRFPRLKPLRSIHPFLLTLACLTLLNALLNNQLIDHEFIKNKNLLAKLNIGLWLLISFCALVVAVHIVTFLIFHFFTGRNKTRPTPKLIQDVMVFIFYCIGILLILRLQLHFNLQTLLASSAVVTVVIGFALQDIIGSLFSGIFITMEDTLKLGDWVKFKDFVGHIEQFRWRSIVLRTIDNELVVIPNQHISKDDVIIYGGSGKPVALRLTIGIGYSHPPDLVLALMQKTAQSASLVLAKPQATIQIKEFGDHAIIYEIKFWITAFADRDMIRSDVRRRLWYALKRHNITIPYPTRQIQISGKKESATDLGTCLALLQNDKILHTIGSEQLERICSGLEMPIFGHGEQIICEGEISAFYYHILRGHVNIVKHNAVVTTLGPGDFFGEMSLVTGDAAGATVIAAEECECLAISSLRFKATVHMNESLARALSEIIIQRQAELREFSERHSEYERSQLIKKDSENLFQRIVKYFNIAD